MSFREKKYTLCKNALSTDMCNVAVTYALLKEQIEYNPEQCKGREKTHSIYADTLMESILLYVQPNIERITNLTLYPTYSYYRVYRPGDSLPQHTDRVECEISATMCLGRLYKDAHTDYSWDMSVCVDGEPPDRPVCAPGDMVVYKGREVKHWRDELSAGPGSYQVQAFLHYVDVDGPYADRKFDRRPGMGLSASTKTF